MREEKFRMFGNYILGAGRFGVGQYSTIVYSVPDRYVVWTPGSVSVIECHGSGTLIVCLVSINTSVDSLPLNHQPPPTPETYFLRRQTFVEAPLLRPLYRIDQLFLLSC
jgi:hypothetical protein